MLRRTFSLSRSGPRSCWPRRRPLRRPQAAPEGLHEPAGGERPGPDGGLHLGPEPRRVQAGGAGRGPGRKSVDVRARKGYDAPSDDGDAGHRRPGVDSALQEALDSPYEIGTIPLRMTHFVGDETTLGKAHVEVVTEVDLRGLDLEPREGRYLGGFEFLLVTAHRETGESFRYDQKVEMKLLPATRDRLRKTWFPVRREFDLQPGGYQAKIVVRDVRSGRVATVVHRFEVPEIAAFRVSTPSSPTAAGRGTRVIERRKTTPRRALTVVVLLSSSLLLSAQSLGQAAGRERERRETAVASASKVLTDKDLGRYVGLRLPEAASQLLSDQQPAARDWLPDGEAQRQDAYRRHAASAEFYLTRCEERVRAAEGELSRRQRSEPVRRRDAGAPGSGERGNGARPREEVSRPGRCRGAAGRGPAGGHALAPRDVLGASCRRIADVSPTRDFRRRRPLAFRGLELE